jgi:TraM recognition site of TraD and TraG
MHKLTRQQKRLALDTSPRNQIRLQAALPVRRPKKIEPGKPVAQRGALCLGTTDGRPLALTARDRSMHLLIIGASGTGKTTEIESLIQQDIDAGRPFGLIDPMGALYKRILDYYCYRTAIDCTPRPVTLFNPSEGEWVTPYNPFVFRGGDVSVQADRRVQATFHAFGQQTGNETPRLEKILKLLYIVGIQCNLTITEIIQLIDQNADGLRTSVLRDVSNDLVRSKIEQLARCKPADFLNQVESAENRLMRFVTSTTIARVMGLGTNALDCLRMMDERRSFMANLQPSQHLSGEGQRLLGGMLFTECFEAALMRPSGASPFYLYIDEAARFVTETFAEAAEQCRQKGLHITFAFQHLSQFKTENPRVYKALKNNVRNKIVFAVPDREDATELADDLFVNLTDPELKFMRRRLNHLVLDTRDTSTTRSAGDSRSATTSDTFSQTFGQTSGQSEGTSVSRSHGSSQGSSRGRSYGSGTLFQTTSGQSHAYSQSESHSRGFTETNSRQESHGLTSSETTHEYDRSGSTLEGARRDLTKGESHHSAASFSHTDTGQDSYASSESHSRTKSRSSGGSSSATYSRSKQQSQSTNAATGRSTSRNSSRSESQSRARGTAEQHGRSEGFSVTDQPGTRHIPFQEEDPEHWTLAERRWQAAELLMHQGVGQWFVSTASAYGAGTTLMPRKFYLSADQMILLQHQLYQQSCITPEAADQIIEERKRQLIARSNDQSSFEPDDSAESRYLNGERDKRNKKQISIWAPIMPEEN